MKTGIIIHSRSNHTLTVGERLMESLQASERASFLDRVKAVNEDPQAKEKVHLASAPSVSAYDYVVIGAPVEAFSLSPVMNAYLNQLSGLDGKKVALFVTQHFPKAWMGGNRAIRQMVSHVTRLGGTVTQTAVVNWSSKAREEQIGNLVAAFSKAEAIGG